MNTREVIVVTGAGGLVGRAVCYELRSQRLDILPIAQTLSSHLPADALILDLSKTLNLEKLISENVVGVVHLAAAVPHSVGFPDNEASAQLTHQMDLNVLEAVKQWKCPVVYMSTCGLYDRSLSAIKVEDDRSQIKIESPYFSAKLAGEASFAEVDKAAVMRLAAPVGAGIKAGLVVSRFVELARKNQAIQLWGTGLREQNFIDVTDVARIVTMAIKNPKNCLINVASKRATSMIDLAKTVVEVVGTGRIEFSDKSDPRDGETARYSIELAKSIYGWSPQVSLADAICNISDVEFSE